MRVSCVSVLCLAAAPAGTVAFAVFPSTSTHNQQQQRSSSSSTNAVALQASQCGNYDFDVAIVGCGVGGHGAALHARAQDLSTAVFVGNDVGGTCVNRGCVPSKALLAAAGRVRDMQNAPHLADLGIAVEGKVTYDRQGIANHAANLAAKVKGNLEGSLVGLGVQMINGRGALTEKAHEIRDEETGKVYTAKVCLWWWWWFCVDTLDHSPTGSNANGHRFGFPLTIQ